MTGHPGFAIGLPVVDRTRDAAERGTMRVLEYATDEDDDPLTADEVEFREGMTVAMVNDEQFRNDRVARVVFEGHLDETFPEWDEDAENRVEAMGGLPEAMAEFADEWGVSFKTYEYPEGRLMRRPYCARCETRADHLDAREVSTGEPGYYCVNPECEDPVVLPFDAWHGDPEDSEGAEDA